MCASRSSRYLTLTDRIKIEAWAKHGVSQAEIARRLGVNRSTICRELRKGQCEQIEGKTYKRYFMYSADIAQKRCDWTNSAKGAQLKIGKRYDYLAAIEQRVLDHHSFEDAIAYCAPAFDVHISKQTAYRYLQMGLFPSLCYEQLPRGKRKARRGKVRRANQNSPDHTSIELRPKEVQTRSTFGHWELDSIIGKAKGHNESCLVLSERLTRQEIILRPKEKTAAATVAALQGLRKALGRDYSKIIKTITCDNGSEFSDRKGMEIDETTFYWCHPQSPGERGTNENTNRLIRRKLPKGKSLSRLTPKQAKQIQQWVNDYRRPILGGKCSQEVFFEELDKLDLQDPDRVKRFFL